jgi:glycosyltransferase involved in cell wall biosynthesis
MSGRKGTQLFLDAIPMVKSDVKFIIYSWRPFESNDPRLEVKVQNFKNYWQMWREGDVLVYPQDYNGICLPIIEAMTSGLGVITTDIYPFNEYMPKELLFKPRSMYKTRAAPSLMETDAARIDPRDIAAKIDEWANRDISRFSKYGKEWGEQNNWETLGPKIAETLENLVSA